VSINPTAIVSLVTVLLAGCNGSGEDVNRVINALTGKVDQQSQDLAATRVHTDAEIAELRKTYSALALTHSQPSTEALEALVPAKGADPHVNIFPEIEHITTDVLSSGASSEPVINEADLPCQEYEGVFRVWHCEDGKRMYP